MATNPPKNNARVGAIKKRFQFKNSKTDLWVKYDLKKKKIADNKTTDKEKPFKGVRKK